MENKLSPSQKNYLHSIYLVVQNLKLCFSCKDNVKKCTSFKKQNGTRSADNTEI